MVEDGLIRIMPPTIKTLKLGPRTEYRNTEDGDPDESYEGESSHVTPRSWMANATSA